MKERGFLMFWQDITFLISLYKPLRAFSTSKPKDISDLSTNVKWLLLKNSIQVSIFEYFGIPVTIETLNGRRKTGSNGR